MNKKLLIPSMASLLLALPGIGLAGNSVPLLPLPGLVGITPEALFSALFNLIWPFFAAYAVIMYIIAAFMFFTANGEAGKVKDARNAIIWGSVGVAVGVLAFSLPFLIAGLLQ